MEVEFYPGTRFRLKLHRKKNTAWDTKGTAIPQREAADAVTLYDVPTVVGGTFTHGANVDVQVTFQNTSTAPLSLCLVDENGNETVRVAALAAGSEVSVNAIPGNVWLAKLDGQVFAEYTVDDSEEQEVDLALEGTWRLTVEVVLQNNTNAAVSLWMIDENDQPVALCELLDAGQQWEQPGLATGSFL